MMRGMAARRLALSLTVALATGCALRATRPAPASIAPPSPAVVVALSAGEATACRLEVERLPAATFAVELVAMAREERLVGALRDVAVELEGGRPVLVLRVLPPDGASPPPQRLCAWASELAARLERDARDEAVAAATPRWPAGFDPGEVRFRSVQRVVRGSETLGFAEYAIGARPDGARVLLSRGAFLQRRDGGWAAADALQVEDADARGMLVKGRYARFQGGVLHYRVDLRREGERAFAYSGEAKGQPIGGTFATSAGLATMLFRIDLFRERGGGPPPGPVLVETYDPQADPVRATPIVHRRDPARRRGIVTQIGGRTATGVVAPDGTLEWIEAAGEPPTRTETIWRDGAP
jgi:hypothetical protein